MYTKKAMYVLLENSNFLIQERDNLTNDSRSLMSPVNIGFVSKWSLEPENLSLSARMQFHIIFQMQNRGEYGWAKLVAVAIAHPPQRIARRLPGDL